MKKILLYCVAFLLASCSTITKDEAVTNAEHFVIEKLFLNMDNVESVEGVVQDSLLGITHISFANLESINKTTSYYKGEVSEDECVDFLDSINDVLTDTYINWEHNGINNEELHKNKKFNNCWKKVINVTITYKSHTKQNVLVLMDSDGKTPWKIDEEVKEEIIKVKSNIDSVEL